MKTYIIEDTIQLGILVTRGNVPQTGKTVVVSVYAVDDYATPLVSSQTLTESSEVSGFYYYDWSHTLTAKTFMVAMYEVESKKYTEDLLIDIDLRHEIDDQDADGDGVAL